MPRISDSGWTVLLGAVALGLVIMLASLSLLSGNFQQASATFPGINGKIAFSRSVQSQSEIYVMSADGSSPTRLTNTPSSETQPAWSPDGSKIAYVSNASGNSDIYVMNADGSSPTQLTSYAGDDLAPAWSPDGSKIVFAHGGSTYYSHQIHVMNADGSGPTALTTTQGDNDPSWSPDGTRIVFSRVVQSGLTQVFVMNADGTDQTQLTFGMNDSAFGPDWSPDGSRIVFQMPAGNQDIFIMNADGTGVTDISNSPSTFDAAPAWSPDGTKIAFYRDGDIAVMNSDSSSGLTVLTSGGLDGPPSWQRIPGPTPTPTPCPTHGCPTRTPTRTPTNTPTPRATSTPCPGPPCPLDFSVGVRIADGAGADCDSSGVPTHVCDIPLGATFNVNVLLHGLPPDLTGGDYAGFDANILYSGVMATETKSSLHPNDWPGCALAAPYFTPGNVRFACAVGPGAPESTYTGRMLAPEFTCAADGTITLVHGNGNTDIEDATFQAFSEASDESLAIHCVAPLAYPNDADSDGCPDAKEQGINPMMGGQRNFLNPWDYFNPTRDGQNRVDDILAVVQHFRLNQGDPGYSTGYDRTYIGPNKWNLGPPDGHITVADILAIVNQFGHDCS